MRSLITLAAIGAWCIALPTHGLGQAAPETAPVIHVPAAVTESTFRELAKARTARGAAIPALEVAIDTATTGDPRFRYWVAARRETAVAEIHEEWTDVVFVRSGTAVLRTGPRLADGRLEAPHEWRGAVIEHSQDRHLGPGDVVIIPAGVAHQYRPTGSAPFAYLTVKLPPRSSR